MHSVALLFWPTAESISSESCAHHIWSIFEASRSRAKKAMRHYAQTQPHKNKRQKLLNLKKFPSNKCWVYHELKTNPICPGYKHHDKPMKSSDGSSRNCVVCSTGTKWSCWGCTIDLRDVFPVCPIETRPECFANMHRMRTDISVALSFQ